MENFKQHERGREMLFLKMKHSITVERGGLGINIWSFLSCLSSHCFSLPVSEETSSVFVFAEAFHGLGHCFNLSPLFPSRPIPSHACQCYDSPTLTDTCIKNRCSKADISLAIIVLITQLHFFSTVDIFPAVQTVHTFLLCPVFLKCLFLRRPPHRPLHFSICTDIKFRPPPTDTCSCTPATPCFILHQLLHSMSIKLMLTWGHCQLRESCNVKLWGALNVRLSTILIRKQSKMTLNSNRNLTANPQHVIIEMPI